jgi:hypothetical protein
MRPVDKGGRGTYAPDIDVSTQQDLLDSLGNYDLLFQGVAAPKVRKLWNTNQPTARQVLTALERLRTWDGNPPAKKQKGVPTSAQVDSIKGTLTGNLTNVYTTAGPTLENQMGRFCSLCEVYQPGGVAVEHIVPKAPYPLFYIAWDNFLLACTVCNSNKLSKPARTDPLFAPPPADDVGYYDTILTSYLWPHKFSDIYRVLPPKLEYKSATTWKAVTYPAAAGTTVVKDDSTTGEVRANVSVLGTSGNPIWRNNVLVRVRLDATNPRGTRMVGLAGLNKESGLTRSDARIYMRTVHWFNALTALRLLQNSGGMFEQMWQMMMLQVRQPGFYTNWVAIIDALGPNGAWTVPVTGGSVMTRFLTEITGNQYFPGTDTANTP